MAGTKEIKTHIESVGETRKITNAMYLIASTKLRRARQELDQTRPYFEALRGEIRRIFRTAYNVDSRFFYPIGDDTPLKGTYGCLLITADKGLAGAYNQNAIRVAQELLDRHPDTKLFVVGEYGRRFFDQRKIPIEHSFLYTAQNPTMARAREISGLLLDGFDRTARLLPFHRTHFAGAPAGGGAMTERFEFYPDVGTVLDSVMRSYVTGFIYSALIDSFCCEQNARMTAMDNADRNAEKLLGELSLQYNRVRQAAITQEITEISAGARAQRQKKGR